MCVAITLLIFPLMKALLFLFLLSFLLHLSLLFCFTIQSPLPRCPSLSLAHHPQVSRLDSPQDSVFLLVEFLSLLFHPPPPRAKLTFFHNVTNKSTQFLSFFLSSPCMRLMTYEMHFVLWDFDINLQKCHLQ